MRRIPISLATLTRSSVPGDAETPSGTTGEAVPEGDSEAALEWLDAEAAKVGKIWADRWPGGRDW